MGLGDLFTAVAARWTAQSLGDHVTGGLHEGQAPKSVEAMPYAVYSDLGQSVRARTSRGEGKGGEYVERQIQIRLHHNGGLAATLALADRIRAAFDWAPLELATGSLLYCRYEGDAVTGDLEHPSARLWAVTYNVLSGGGSDLQPE